MEEAKRLKMRRISWHSLDMCGCTVLILKLDLLSPCELLAVALKSTVQSSWRKTPGLLKCTLFYCTEHEIQQTWLLATRCKTKEKVATKSCALWDLVSKVHAASEAWPYGEKGNLNILHPGSLSAKKPGMSPWGFKYKCFWFWPASNSFWSLRLKLCSTPTYVVLLL